VLRPAVWVIVAASVFNLFLVLVLSLSPRTCACIEGATLHDEKTRRISKCVDGQWKEAVGPSSPAAQLK
jgi:hypothetical protein